MKNGDKKNMSGHFPPRSNDSGFTLIEVLIAIAIFSIGLMAMGALQASSLMQTGDIGRKTEALSILEQRVDTLKALPFYTSGGALSTGLAEGGHSVASDDGRYDTHWRVENLASESIYWSGTTETVSKLITVAVTRSGGDMDADALISVEFIKTLL